MANDELPKKLSTDWELLRTEKGGGQGDVCVLHNKHDQRKAVLKRLRLLGSAEKRRIAMERFRREIEILKHYPHDNIATILADGGHDDVPWYVTPYGEPLHPWWSHKRTGASAAEIFDLASFIVHGLLNGLALLHELPEPVIHRDIKPENVVICDGTRPVLIDFGVAYRPSDDRLTDTEGRAVANRYVAPNEAYYGAVESPSPAWDCLSMSWLWAWLLAEGSVKYDRFHWRFHRFIDDKRCKRVRAIFAACSEPSLAPDTATKMLDLGHNLGLFVASAEEATNPTTFAAAVAAKQEADTRLLLADSEAQEMIAATVTVLLGPCQDLHGEFCRMLETMPDSLPMHGNPRDDVSSQIAAAIKTERIQRAWSIELRRTRASTYLDHDILSLSPVDENVIPVGFRFRIRDADQTPCLHYCYTKDLTIRRRVKGGSGKWEVGAATDKSEIVAEVQAWLADPALWQ